MLRKVFSATLALTVGLALVTNAIAGPVTSSVDVQLNDALVLAAPGELNVTGAGSSVPILADYGSAALSAGGVLLIEGLAGPSEWATQVVVQYSVTTSASVDTIGNTTSAPAPLTITIPPGSILKQSSGGSFPDAGISTTSSIGAAPTFATGTASVLTPLSATIDADTGVGAADGAFANATANSFNRVVSITVANAATIMGLTVDGTDTFTLNLYLNTLLASIDLDTTSLGDMAFGQFDVNATAAVNDVQVDTNSFNRSRTVFDGTDLDGSVPAPAGGDFTATGPGPNTAPHTTLGLGSTPFLSFDVSANDVITITIDVTSTSQAQVTSPVPEPTSVLLFGLGAVALSVYSVRRQRQNLI